MDLAKIQPSERIIEIHHPGDENKLVGVRVTLMSIADPRMKTIKRRISDEKLKREARGKNFKADEIEDNLHTIVFSAMTGWEWYGKDVSFNGKKPEFNKASVMEVFKTLEWFADQLQNEISDEKSFFTNSELN